MYVSEHSKHWSELQALHPMEQGVQVVAPYLANVPSGHFSHAPLTALCPSLQIVQKLSFEHPTQLAVLHRTHSFIAGSGFRI